MFNKAFGIKCSKIIHSSIWYTIEDNQYLSPLFITRDGYAGLLTPSSLKLILHNVWMMPLWFIKNWEE